MRGHRNVTRPKRTYLEDLAMWGHAAGVTIILYWDQMRAEKGMREEVSYKDALASKKLRSLAIC